MLIVDTLIKAEAPTVTITAVEGGRIKINSQSLEEPKVFAAKELPVRTEGKLVLVQRRRSGLKGRYVLTGHPGVYVISGDRCYSRAGWIAIVSVFLDRTHD